MSDFAAGVFFGSLSRLPETLQVCSMICDSAAGWIGITAYYLFTGWRDDVIAADAVRVHGGLLDDGDFGLSTEAHDAVLRHQRHQSTLCVLKGDVDCNRIFCTTYVATRNSRNPNANANPRRCLFHLSFLRLVI